MFSLNQTTNYYYIYTWMYDYVQRATHVQNSHTRQRWQQGWTSNSKQLTMRLSSWKRFDKNRFCQCMCVCIYICVYMCVYPMEFIGERRKPIHRRANYVSYVCMWVRMYVVCNTYCGIHMYIYRWSEPTGSLNSSSPTVAQQRRSSGRSRLL